MVQAGLFSRRFRQALEIELRSWLGVVGAGVGAVAAVFVAALLVIGFLDPERSDELGGVAATTLPWFAIVAAVQILIFLGRSVALACSSNLIDGERRANRVTMIGFGLALAVLGLAVARPAQAQQAAASESTEDYCQRKLGTWFYCNRPQPPPKASKDPLKAERPAEIAAIEAFQKQLDEARQVAIWDPTEENVEKFYRLQQVALDKGGLFADVYRRLVWTNPELDYTLKRPVNQLGKQNWEDERNFDRDLFLRSFSGDIGLFYVFRQNCPACQIASPIVRNFSERFHVDVSPISTDGSRNAYFQKTLVDQGQLKSWGVGPITPALLVYQAPSFDPKTGALKNLTVRGSGGRELKLRPCMKTKGCLTYVGAGVLAVDDIAERIFVLLATNPGQDF